MISSLPIAWGNASKRLSARFVDATNRVCCAASGDAETLMQGADARLRDVVIAVRAVEAGHRDVNHALADAYLEPDRARARREVMETIGDVKPA